MNKSGTSEQPTRQAGTSHPGITSHGINDLGARQAGRIALGRYVPCPGAGRGPVRFVCDAPELAPHAGRPWLRAWAAERLDIPIHSLDGQGAPSGGASVGLDQLARHACVCGATGSGKTRLALHLLAEQIKSGCSVVLLDPKAETVRHLLTLAHAAGMDPAQVTVLSPFLAGTGAPGWNPLDGKASGVTPAQAAADVVSVLEKSTSSWGPRMADLLTNALIVVASHRLSLFELARFLQREDYREGLLSRPLPDSQLDSQDDASALSDASPLSDVAFLEARDYFVSEFAAWSKSERAAAVAPVLNKFRELLRSPFLRSLLCAKRTTLHLGSLWHKPGLVLVHLDAASLGDEGVRLLGGLLAHQLLRTAMRAEGPVPVVLALDEMGVSEEFVGGAAAKILAIARSRGLRLLVACQHLAQLSDGLRSALLANTAVQAFFRLGYADARLVAASLSAGTGERVSKVAADVAKRDAEGRPEAWAETWHAVRDGYGEPVALSPAAITAFSHLAKNADGAAQVEGLRKLALVSGLHRLYVHAADTKEPVELARYLQGLEGEDYWLEVRQGGKSGQGPVRLAVSFPRPRLAVLSHETESERERGWARTLTELSVRHAVVRLAAGSVGTVRVAEVSDPCASPGFERFVSAAIAVSGQTAREVASAQEWRREQMERVAGGRFEHDVSEDGITEDADTRAKTDRGETVPPSSGSRTARRKAAPTTSSSAPSILSTSSAHKTPSSANGSEGAHRGLAHVSVAAVRVGTIAEDGSLA
jgi:hypothetical protein